MPELIEEKSARIIMELMMSAANGICILLKTMTNGLIVDVAKSFQL